jgi:hypothetical protein
VLLPGTACSPAIYHRSGPPRLIDQFRIQRRRSQRSHRALDSKRFPLIWERAENLTKVIYLQGILTLSYMAAQGFAWCA